MAGNISHIFLLGYSAFTTMGSWTVLLKKPLTSTEFYIHNSSATVNILELLILVNSGDIWQKSQRAVWERLRICPVLESQRQQFWVMPWQETSSSMWSHWDTCWEYLKSEYTNTVCTNHFFSPSKHCETWAVIWQLLWQTHHVRKQNKRIKLNPGRNTENWSQQSTITLSKTQAGCGNRFSKMSKKL